MGNDEFWQVVKAQLVELESAKTAADVMHILRAERNPYGPGVAAAPAFFAGGDGDEVIEALASAGWDYVWRKASYYWCMVAPDGSKVTYVEGDVYEGNPPEQRPGLEEDN